MEIKFGKKKIKFTALILCAIITAGSFTYVNYEKPIRIEAKTISEIEEQKAANQNEINEIQKNLDALKEDVSEEKEYQRQLDEKITLQNENIENVNTIIKDLNKKIEEKEAKIVQLEKDIANKQVDIDEGLELFKDRLRAMYVSGNDSLASALVGATDFYDMLSKMELISQIAKHDNDLVDSLMTQLEQFEEAQAQLDIEKTELDSDLTEQEANKKELNAAMEQLNKDYTESKDYIDRKEADMSSAQRDIDSLEEDNKAMDKETAEIEAEIERQQQAAIQQQKEEAAAAEEYNNNDDDYDDNDNTDTSSSDSNSGGDSSGDGETSGSSGSGGGSLGWPVPGFYNISSGYGYRWGSLHAGIDIAGGGISGTTITSADSGTVIVVKTGCSHNYGKNSSCGCNGGWGNYMVVDHGNGISTLYGHCTDVYVSLGQSVSSGEAIGTVGATGWSTGAHLHFEVRVNGSTVDPTGYLY